MKGLLLKDIYLLKDNKMLVAIIFGGSILFVTTNSNASLSFLVSFVTLIMSMLVITTISYDDFDHSNSFLMTLPITRSLYVKEKYCLGFLFAGCGWLLSSIIVTIVQAINVEHMQYGEWLMELIPLLVVAILCLSLMIPVQLKFGGDKGRIALIGCILAIALVGAGLVGLCKLLGVDLDQIFRNIAQLDIIYVIIAVFVVAIVCLFVSYIVSLRIMRKKQF